MNLETWCVNGFHGIYNCYVLVRQVSRLSVSMRRVHVVFSTAGFKDGGKPCPTTRGTAAPWNGIQKPLLLCVSFFQGTYNYYDLVRQVARLIFVNVCT